jgi:NAD(P)-dependent dehydrogenase (short-subunit alcohol dehydrogenase family)
MHVIIGGNGSLGRTLIRECPEEKILVIDKVTLQEASYDQIELDLSDPAYIYGLNLECYPKITKVSILTGINYGKGLFDILLSEWDEMFNVNVRGSFFVIKHLFQYFDRNVSVVLCGSQNGVVGHEDRIGYGESKSALIHLAKNLTVEFSKLQERDIRVNVVSPSYILTGETEYYLTQTVQGQLLRNKIPNRRFIDTECVVSTINFLHSNGSTGIRGQNIVIDNGLTIT